VIRTVTLRKRKIIDLSPVESCSLPTRDLDGHLLKGVFESQLSASACCLITITLDEL
jgi:hypothetical protein